MVWRKWSTIIYIIIANYFVFGALATWVFPVPPQTAPKRTPYPTFTLSVQELQRVEPLTYDFLTPSATPTITGTLPTATLTVTRTVRGTLTISPTITATGASVMAAPTLTATQTPRGTIAPMTKP
jgi:hypothetical protein